MRSTITCIVSFAYNPPLSATFNSNKYVPVTRALTFVVESDGLLILKEAGPEIFVQRKLAIVPSGSLERLPSNITLSTGKTIIVSLPALATGGLFLSAQPSHEYSFLQETKIVIHASKIPAINFRSGFII